MAIGNAVERGTFVYIYNEQGHQVGCVPTGNQPGDGLKGYTSGTVNVQRGSYIYSYNERGAQVNCVSVR